MIEVATRDELESMKTELGQKIDRFLMLLDARLQLRLLNPGDVAKIYGVSRTRLFRERWRMPNFGVSDVPTGHPRWKYATVQQWLDDLAQHKHEWETMSTRNRDKIVAQTAQTMGVL